MSIPAQCKNALKWNKDGIGCDQRCLSFKSRSIVLFYSNGRRVFVAEFPHSPQPIYAKHLRVTRIYLTYQFNILGTLWKHPFYRFYCPHASSKDHVKLRLEYYLPILLAWHSTHYLSEYQQIHTSTYIPTNRL